MFNIVHSSILQTHRIIHCIISIPSKSSTLYNNPLPSSGPARMPMSLLMSAARRECWQRTSCVPGATRSPPVGFHRLLTKQDGRYYYLNSQIKELRQSKFFWDLKPQTRHLTASPLLWVSRVPHVQVTELAWATGGNRRS